MASYIIESIDEAAKRTRELLLPFDLATWSKLALIVLLTGGISFSFPGIPGSGDYGGQQEMHQTGMDHPMSSFDTPSGMTGAFGASSLVMLGVAFFIGLGLVALFVSSVFEFIYYRSLLDEKVEIRENFSNNLSRGARYFNFRVLYTMGLLILTGIGIGFAALNPLLIIPLILALIPVAPLLYAFETLVHDFVLLEMLQEEEKFMDALSKVYGYVRENTKETALYLVARIAVTLLAATAVGLGTFLVLMVLAIPMMFIGLVFYMVSELLLIPLLVIGFALAIATALLVTVPMKTFIYYYAITVYSEFSG